VTETAQLPNGWALAKLGDLVEPSKEKADPKKETNTNYIGLEHIEKETGRLLEFGKSAEVRSQKNRFHRGYLLYGKLRPYLNKVYVAEFDGICSTDIIVFQSRSWLSNKFMLYRFLSRDFVKYANQNMSGVQHPRIDYSKIARFEIGLPPISEQNRIASKIEELFSFLDAGIESLRKVQAQLKRYRQAVLKYAFEGKLTEEWRKTCKNQIEPAKVLFKKITEKRISNNSQWKNLEPINAADLPEIPSEWMWVRAQEVCENITNGYTPKAPDLHKLEGEIPFIKINNLTFNGKLDFSKNSTFIDKQIHDKMLKRSKVFPGDVLINIVGPPLGKVSIVPNDYPEWNINQAIVFFRPIEGYNRDFLALCLQTETMISQLTNQAKATAGQFNISVNMSRNLPIPLPPREEQGKIIYEVRKTLAAIEGTELAMHASLLQADNLRDSILKSAFSGQLVPQDPSDEPAEMLLRRIKEQKSDWNKNNSRGLMLYVK